jgi:hypothetical protein
VARQIHGLNIALKCFDTPNIGRCHALSSAWHLFVRIGFTTPLRRGEGLRARRTRRRK